jgi:uncharacterized protein YjeT (DUF2065 family)
MKWMFAVALTIISVCQAQTAEKTAAPASPPSTKTIAEKQAQPAKLDDSKKAIEIPPSAVNVSPAQSENDQLQPVASHESNAVWFAETLTALATFLLPVITGLLAFFTYRLWRSTGRLVQGAAETAERQLRAYVLPVDSWFTIDDKGLFTFQIALENSGQTPAYDMQAWIHVEKREFPLKGELVPIAAQSKTFLAAKGKTFLAASFPEPKPLTQEEHSRIILGSMAIYLFGEVKYLDTFRKEARTTRFRMMCLGENLRSKGLLHCEEGNYAD